MNIQSSVVVVAVLFLVLLTLIKMFVDKRISSGQTLFWLVLVAGAQVLTVFPGLIDRLSALWGNLVPVSWITFAAIVLIVFYLIYLTVRLNGASRIVELARSNSLLERRLRDVEARYDELSRRHPQSE